MTTIQTKNPKKCFACLKKAATRNAFLAVLISGSILTVAIYVFQLG